MIPPEFDYTAPDSLDGALRALAEAGARVVSCESERGTLYDVLETFERETEGGR